MIRTVLTRRRFLLTAASAAASAGLPAATRTSRSFWVLGLLHPTSLIVRPFGPARLHCLSRDGPRVIEGPQFLSITANSMPVQITGPDSQAVHCVLEIPNIIRRHYFGTFQFFAESGVIIPVVTIDCELATASIVQAELPVAAAAPDALAAQAVVSRSLLCGTLAPRHKFADFCDTTHCQFFRSPAVAGSTVAYAVNHTRGFVLVQRDRILPSLYSAACGGRTEDGVDGGYQYASVGCEICQRANIARRGHGWGLCQEGAMGLARSGWNWRDIVAKYYPNALLRDRSALM